jgi:Icc-related predicted phosphoesterase
MKKLTLILLISLYIFPAFATRVNGDDLNFLVRPYLYSYKGQSIRIAWSYKVPPPTDTEITAMFANQFESKSLKIARDGELYTAELPMATCGFGANISYLVSGMTAAENIAPIACPGELGNSSKFVFLADSQVDTKEGVLPLDYFAKQIEKTGRVSAVIVGGDLVQTGAKFDLWTQFFNSMNPLLKNILLIPVMGNHEYHGDKTVRHWPHFFGVTAHDAMYTTTIGEAQIFVLNSSFTDDPSLIEPEVQWLENELARSSAKWRIVSFHHPPYSVGIANNPAYPKKEFRVVQKRFVPLFEKYHVNLVLNGHVHIFERSELHGVQYLIMGPAAGKIGPFGGLNPNTIISGRIRTMATVEVSDEALIATTTDLEGNVVDVISLMGWQNEK